MNAIDLLGMDTCKVNNDGTVSPLYQMNEVTVTAPALYKKSVTYLFFGELAYGNRSYLSEYKNPYIWTNRENNRGVKAEMQAGLMLAGGVGTAIRVGTIAYRSLKGLDIAFMAGRALADAIGQYGGNLLQKQSLLEAALNINVLSSTLTGLGVDPFSASVLSSAVTIKGNGMGIFEKSPDDYLTNAALGTLFGLGGNVINNLSQYKGLTIGVQMRTAQLGATISVDAAPTSISTAGSTYLSK